MTVRLKKSASQSNPLCWSPGDLALTVMTYHHTDSWLGVTEHLWSVYTSDGHYSAHIEQEYVQHFQSAHSTPLLCPATLPQVIVAMAICTHAVVLPGQIWVRQIRLPPGL